MEVTYPLRIGLHSSYGALQARRFQFSANIGNWKIWEGLVRYTEFAWIICECSPSQIYLLTVASSFHFGVLHPVARALSRLSGKPSFATTAQGVYCIYTATATCFGLHWPSSSGTHIIIYKEVIILTTDALCVVQIVLCTLFDKWMRLRGIHSCMQSPRFLISDVGSETSARSSGC
jgi:hypothetical protein